MGAIYSTLNLQGNMQQQLNGIRNSALGVRTAMSRLENVSVNASQNMATAQRAHNKALKQGSDVLGSMARRMVVLFALYKGIEGMKSMFALADTRRSINGRLQFVVDKNSLAQANGDMDKAVAQMNDKIMDIANKTRSSFVDTANFVAKVGVNAGRAFKNNDELLNFSEQLNRAFIVAGTTSDEMRSVMLQLPQALGKGILNGDELRSVQEAAPVVARSIEDYAHQVLGATGSLKDMASQGQITSRVIIDAMKWASADMEERFERMPKTWAQVLTVAHNNLIKFIEPMTKALSFLANTEGLSGAFKQITAAISICANAMVLLVEIALNFISIFAQAGNVIPIVNVALTVTALWAGKAAVALVEKAIAVGMDMAATVGHAAAQLWDNTQTIAGAIATGLHTAYRIAAAIAAGVHQAATVSEAVAFGVLNGVLSIVTVAQAAYNAVVGIGTTVMAGFSMAEFLVAAGAMFVHACVFAVVIILVMLVAKMVWASAGAETAIGKICYIFGYFGATVWNIITEIWNFIISFVEFLANVFDDPLNACKKLFWEFGRSVVNILDNVAKAIDKIFHTNTSGFLSNLKKSADEALEDLNKEYKPKYDLSGLKMKEVNQEQLAAKFGKAGDKFQGRLENMAKQAEGLGGAGGAGADLDSLKSGVGDTAKNTGRMASAMESSAEDLKYLRTYYEGRSIQIYSKLEAPIAPTINIQTGASSVDGIVHDTTSTIADAIREALLVGAEGVHA